MWTQQLMSTFPGFEDEQNLRNWMMRTAQIRDQLYVLPSIMHEDGIGKPPPPIPADFVRDGVIDYKDLDVLTDNWLLAPPTDPIVDLYPDGKIDFRDLAEFGKYWLEEQL